MPIRFVLFLSIIGLSSCLSDSSPDLATSVAGQYQLVEYVTTTTSDEMPTGTMSLTRLDNKHVKLVVTGKSNTTVINYQYASVEVISLERSLYQLRIKGNSIGQAGDDGLNRYVTLMPKATLTLQAEEL